MCLFFVPLPQSSNCSQVVGIKVSFTVYTLGSPIEIKRCGVGLVYSNEDWNRNNHPMIQFNSISSSPPSPPFNNSTLVLEEIHEGEPSGSNVDDSEEMSSEYHTADDEEPPNTATACSKGHSEVDICGCRNARNAGTCEDIP